MLRNGPLKKAIDQAFGNLEAFEKKFNTSTAGIQGSGWGWLVSGTRYSAAVDVDLAM